VLPHIVTPEDVTAWHDTVDRPRTFCTLQNARQQHRKHQSDGGQHVASLLDITQKHTAFCLLQIVSSAVSDVVVWLLDRYN